MTQQGKYVKGKKLYMRAWYKKHPNYMKEWHKKHPEHAKASKERFYAKYPGGRAEHRRAAALKHNYDLSVEDYEKLLRKQRGLCAICREPESVTYKGKGRRFNVDHDHNTGQIRGLLCMACNCKLSTIEDTVFLKLAQKYIEIAGRAK